MLAGMRVRLDNRTIKAAIAQGQRVEIWDTTAEGLHVVVTPAGAATFAVRYRCEGRQRRLRVGRFGPLTIEEARKRARAVLADAARGADPQGDKQRARSGLSLLDAFERFMDEPGKRGARKARTTELYRQIFRDHIAPSLGRTRLDAVERREVERIKVAVSKSIGPVVANRTLTVLSALMGAAERWGEIGMGSNPCRGVTRFREQGRERFLRADERAAMWAVLDAAAGKDAGAEGYLAPGAVLCVRLLALTGARLSEITGLTWSMVDLDRACLRLPDSKTGAKVVPLTSQAVELLGEHRPKHVIAGALVCPSARDTPLRNMGRVWSLIRENAGLEKVRLHDLRHSFASDALNAGAPLAHVGAVLGHADQRTTARYAHVANEALRRSVAAAGDAIEVATREGAKVVRLPVAKRPKPATVSKRRRKAGKGG